QIPGAWLAWQADDHWRAAQALQDRANELKGEERYKTLREALHELREARTLQPGHVEYGLRVAIAGWQTALAAFPPDAVLTPQKAPELVGVARQASAEIVDAIRACPTYGLPWTMLGQFGLRWTDDPDAPRWIRRGRELSPEEPDACLAA